jgi:hypothetical protein
MINPKPLSEISFLILPFGIAKPLSEALATSYGCNLSLDTKGLAKTSGASVG